MNKKEINKKLEHFRKEIEAEKISYGEIAELQSLKKYIDKGDTLLLEWAGVKENMKGLKKFKVGIWEETGGFTIIEAKNEKEAEEKAQYGLEEDGINYFKDFRTTHRSIYIVNSPEEI